MKRTWFALATLLISVLALATPLEEEEAKCRRGDKRYCGIAGGKYEEQGRHELAQQLYEIQCRDATNWTDCYSLTRLAANLLRDGHAEKALAIYTKRCEQAKENSSCLAMARIYRDGGKGLAADPTKATGVLDGFCRKGSFSACDELSEMFAKGIGVTKDAAKAKQYEQLKRAGLDQELARAAQTKEAEIKALPQSAVTSSESNCLADPKEVCKPSLPARDRPLCLVEKTGFNGCSRAARILSIRAPDRVVPFFKSYCTLAAPAPEHCKLAAAVVLNDLYLTAKTRAHELSAELCDAGLSMTCGQHASWMLQSDPPQRTKAITYSRKGCDAGDEGSCGLLASLLKDGSPAEKKEATEHRARLDAIAAKESKERAARDAEEQARKAAEDEQHRTLAPRREALQERRRELEERKRAWQVEKKRREAARERGELLDEAR